MENTIFFGRPSSLFFSHFHALEAVVEEQEGGTLVLLLLLVGKAPGALHVVLGPTEHLHLVPLRGDELSGIGRALLEVGDAVSFASLLELLDHLGQVSLDPAHEVLLAHALDLIQLEGVNDVDDGLTLASVVVLLVGGDLDVVVALLGVAPTDSSSMAPSTISHVEIVCIRNPLDLKIHKGCEKWNGLMEISCNLELFHLGAKELNRKPKNN